MLCVASSTKLLDCCWCVHYTVHIVTSNDDPFASWTNPPYQKNRLISRSFWWNHPFLRSVSWSDCQHAGLSPAMFFFGGGRFGVNMGNRARKKYNPGGPDGPVFKVNFANENFEAFFLVEERGMVSYVTLLKKNDWHGNLKRTIQNFQKWDVLWCAHRPNVT